MAVQLLPLVLKGVVIGYIVKKVLFALGMGYVTYTGYTFIVDQMAQLFSSVLAGGAGENFGIVVCSLRLQQVASIMLSAYTTKAVMMQIKVLRPI